VADNVAITAGAGTNVAADERTIAAATVQVQRVTDIGGTAVATAQTNITNSAATLIAARDTRKSVTFINHMSRSVFIGPATVTTANGFELPAEASATLYTVALLQGITAAASGATEYVHTIEVYDS
jgi:hypothetical protein